MTPDILILWIYRGLALVIAVAMAIVMIRSRDWRPQFYAMLIFVVFALLNWAITSLIASRGARWGIESMSDVGGFPLLVFLVSAIFFFATPITNTMIRTQELEADLFGLNAAREPDAEAHVDIMLAEYRKLEPGKWEEILFFDHPSGKVRVTTAMTWKAEHLNDVK